MLQYFVDRIQQSIPFVDCVFSLGPIEPILSCEESNALYSPIWRIASRNCRH
jgi:hypothetical protein